MVKLCLGAVATLLMLVGAVQAAQAEYVVAISVDGMGSCYAQQMMDEGRMPNLKRLAEEGAFTMNARADNEVTITLPNHTAMVTGRPVKGEAGHAYTDNSDPKPGVTLHNNKKSYVASAFDVAHDAGLSTGMWATKTKFSLFRDSYNDINGSADGIGAAKYGRKKIDEYVYADSSEAVVTALLASMKQKPVNFAFVHIMEPDQAGHAEGWGGVKYKQALEISDHQIGRILDFINADAQLKDRTVVIVTADHGGVAKNHQDPTFPLDYTIPFLVWGAGVDHGDLYEMNPSRKDPGTERVSFLSPNQPIRNGDLGNLSMKLLGLPAIPGSLIGRDQDLQTGKAKVDTFKKAA